MHISSNMLLIVLIAAEAAVCVEVKLTGVTCKQLDVCLLDVSVY